MSFKPSEFIKDTFRNSLKVLWLTLLTFAGNEILMENYNKALSLFQLSVYVVFILGITYIPNFIQFLREQIVAYVSFKTYAPKVAEIDTTLRTLKHEKAAEQILNDIPEVSYSEREAALMDTINLLESKLEGKKR